MGPGFVIEGGFLKVGPRSVMRFDNRINIRFIDVESGISFGSGTREWPGASASLRTGGRPDTNTSSGAVGRPGTGAGLRCSSTELRDRLW